MTTAPPSPGSAAVARHRDRSALADRIDRVRKAISGLAGRSSRLDRSFRGEQRHMIETAFTFTTSNGVRGDYLEFGVYRGDTFVDAWAAAQRRGQHAMRFFAFDSFCGLPDPEGSPVDRGGRFTHGQFSADRATFERTLRRARVDQSRVTVVEGFYEESLRTRSKERLGLEAAGVVWIDCDLYASAVLALDFVTPVLVDGSVLAFDDWHCFRSRPDLGEQRACAEWLARNPEIRLVRYRDFHWAGRSFIVHVDRVDGV